jgi:hypothetical protein
VLLAYNHTGEMHDDPRGHLSNARRSVQARVRRLAVRQFTRIADHAVSSMGANVFRQNSGTEFCRNILALRQSLLRRHDFLALLTELLDPERHHIAGIEKYGRGLHAKADTGWRTGDDDVARLHHEEL